MLLPFLGDQDLHPDRVAAPHHFFLFRQPPVGCAVAERRRADEEFITCDFEQQVEEAGRTEQVFYLDRGQEFEWAAR